MVKKLFVGAVLLSLLMCIEIVSAIDTQVTIKTLENHKVDISILNPEGVYSLIESFHEDSGSLGEVSVSFSSSLDTFNLRVWLKKDGELVIYKKFEEEYPTGEPLVLEIYPAGFEPELEVNESTLNEAESENESLEGEGTITGSPVFGEGGIFSKKGIYYTVIVFLVLAVVAFFVMKKFNVIKSKPHQSDEKPDENKNTRDDSVPPSGGESRADNKSIIEDAERKIREAQEEIRRIKDEEKVNEIRKKLIEDKKRIIEDQRELLRLRGEGNPQEERE
jgi:hypothetical protein